MEQGIQELSIVFFPNRTIVKYIRLLISQTIFEVLLYCNVYLLQSLLVYLQTLLQLYLADLLALVKTDILK